MAGELRKESTEAEEVLFQEAESTAERKRRSLNHRVKNASNDIPGH